MSRRLLLASGVAAIGWGLASPTYAQGNVRSSLAFPELGYPLACPLARNKVALNGMWEVIVDPMKVGAVSPFEGFPAAGFQKAEPWSDDMKLQEWSFDPSVQMRVPGDWNSQSERLFFYEGDVWYHRRFRHVRQPQHRTLIHFGAVNYYAEVYVNGKPAGRHEGGFTPFTIDVTDLVVADENTLVLRVNNELGPKTIPTRFTDWMNYGGITRAVHIVTVPDLHIRDFWIRLLDAATKSVALEVRVAGAPANTPVTIEIPALGEKISGRVNSDGLAKLTWRTKANLWSPSSPQLYDVIIRAGSDEVRDKIGLRTIKVVGTEISLNGVPLFLRGISAHEESTLHAGRAQGPDDARATLDLVKALNGNFIRLAHYPHDDATARLADEMGILVWAEQPLYWGIAWGDAGALESAKAQCSEMVIRDRNRAAIIMWSIANETPQRDDRLSFLTQIAAHIRSIDPDRPLTAALFGDPRGFVSRFALTLAARIVLEVGTPSETAARLKNLIATRTNQAVDALTRARLAQIADDIPTITISDPLGSVIDVIGYNQYLGWYYEATLAQALGIDEAKIRTMSLALLPQIKIGTALPKPLIISEFGADAKAGVRGPQTQVFSEEFQAYFYNQQIAMISKIPTLRGISPWVLKDFRAPRRSLPHLQDYWNRKGLVDETGRRKLAFDVLSQAYSATGVFGTRSAFRAQTSR